MYSKNLKAKFEIFYTAPDIPDDNRCDMIVICCSVLTSMHRPFNVKRFSVHIISLQDRLLGPQL